IYSGPFQILRKGGKRNRTHNVAQRSRQFGLGKKHCWTKVIYRKCEPGPEAWRSGCAEEGLSDMATGFRRSTFAGFRTVGIRRIDKVDAEIDGAPRKPPGFVRIPGFLLNSGPRETHGPETQT